MDSNHYDRYQNNHTKKLQLNGIGLIHQVYSKSRHFYQAYLWSRYATKSTYISEYVIINIKESKKYQRHLSFKICGRVFVVVNLKIQMTLLNILQIIILHRKTKNIQCCSPEKLLDVHRCQKEGCNRGHGSSAAIKLGSLEKTVMAALFWPGLHIHYPRSQ